MWSRRICHGFVERSEGTKMSVALVLGASRGIGLALVEKLALHPSYDRVIATHRPTSDITSLSGLAPNKVQLVEYDARLPGSEKLLAESLTRLGVESLSW